MVIGELSETYPPTQDGVGRVSLAYCRGLEQLGHTVYYIAPEDAGKTHVPGLKTLLYKSVQIPKQNYRIGIPGMSWEFKKTLKEIPFDILHLHTPFLSAKVAREILEERDIPVVATFHSKYYDDFYKATKSKLIATNAVNSVLKVYERCDGVWTVNHETARVLQSYGYQGRIDIVPNGTDLPELNPAGAELAKKNLGLRKGIPVLLFVGQIDMKKNIHSILKACAILKEREEPFYLLLAGEGPDRAKLQKMAHELGIAAEARFLGFMSNAEELSNLYALADLFVFPSEYDNAPMVVREAAANGTPALTIRGSCSAEGIIHGENGFLCKNTPEDIADGILSALPECARAGIKARETIPMPWNEIMKDVVQRYQSLIDARK